MHHETYPEIPVAAAQADSAAVLSAKGLACSRGGRTLFSALDLQIQAGQLLRISGDNGSGKSSLLRLLCGLLSPTAGQVQWHGQDIAERRESFYSELIYLGHTPALKGDLSVLENLVMTEGLSGHKIPPEAARTALLQAGLRPLANRAARTLSQGQRQRVCLARLYLKATKPLWLLDEPFNALDQAACAQLQDLISQHLGAGGMVALSSHQSLSLDQHSQAVHISL